jgi:hypothetical protein
MVSTELNQHQFARTDFAYQVEELIDKHKWGKNLAFGMK